MQPKAQIISGKNSDLIARQNAGTNLEIGELLISESNNTRTLFQVTETFYGSQISQQNLERISGISLSEEKPPGFFENELRNYRLAKLKAILEIAGERIVSSRKLPEPFTMLREVTEDDLKFLKDAKSKLYLGQLRSGTKALDLSISLDGEKVLSHHILITGTTGRGKSVLMKNIIWSCTEQNYASMLIFDPHDEYYGRNSKGMKDYPDKDKIIYYTSRIPPTGQRTLKIHLKQLRPDHFDFLDLSSPQRQAMYLYFKKFGKDWIQNLLTQDISKDEMKNEINEMSLAVSRRRLKLLLDIDEHDGNITCSGIFSNNAGENTIHEITNELENSKTVIIDTSTFSGQAELLVASMIATETLNKYKNYSTKGTLAEKPVVNIVLEEAPRVIGKDILSQGPNIFSTIAREGRKFRIGLTAITQMPSLIPKEVLANMNTKIILGTEMNTERQAIIESASQDLSSDDRAIASLDVGECIVSSNFARFAIPLKIPDFDKRTQSENSTVKKSFPGLKQ